MRIGLLTYHCPPNFGAQLQAISTVGFLRKCGHEPIVLHYYPKDLENMYAKRIPLSQIECHKKFTKEVLPLSEFCTNEQELINEIDRLDLDGIILGSDALFKYVPRKRRKYFSLRRFRFCQVNVISCEDLLGNPFFGGFIEKIKKRIPVSVFSVSSQNCPYNEMTNEECTLMGRWMKQFSTITVRDEWTSNMVKHLTGLEKVSITPDPVFSFNQNCYIKIPTKQEIIKKYKLKEDYILFSFSNKYMHEDYIDKLAEEVKGNNLQPVALPMPEGLYRAKIETKIELPLSPIDWYALIINSKGYIGERMHPIVVCIHNTIPFFCFDEYGTIKRQFFGLKKNHNIQSSKTYHIIQKANLLESYYSYWEHSTFPLPSQIVSKIINFKRNECLSFSKSQEKQYRLGMYEILNNIKV